MPADWNFTVTSDGERYVADVSRFRRHSGDLLPAMRGPVKTNVRNATNAALMHGGHGLRRAFQKLSNVPWIVGGKLVRPGYLDWKRGVFASMHKGTRGGDGSWWAYLGTRGTHWPQPLSLSGRLHESLTSASRGAIWRSFAHGFEYGTAVRSSKGYDYPRAHAKGLGRNPKRNFLSWDLRGPTRAIWASAIMSPVQRYLRVGMKSMEKYGFVDPIEFERQARIAQIEGGP